MPVVRLFVCDCTIKLLMMRVCAYDCLCFLQNMSFTNRIRRQTQVATSHMAQSYWRRSLGLSSLADPSNLGFFGGNIFEAQNCKLRCADLIPIFGPGAGWHPERRQMEISCDMQSDLKSSRRQSEQYR